jgi:DNA-directed RNA polymerase II subunit RPB4
LNPDGCRVYNKTLEYVRTFAKFTTADATMAVRTALGREPALTQFETAQIANLCPADADEAKSIVPRCGSSLRASCGYAMLKRVQPREAR